MLDDGRNRSNVFAERFAAIDDSHSRLSTQKLIVRGLIRDLAKAENINESYLGRVLRLTLLAPKIIEDILEGKQPASLELECLLRKSPVEWSKQLEALSIEESRTL
jgi:hypothetical protein